MATISSDTYLDSASRSAGEAMTINSGARLTIRTDSRIHANAPASMTGSMGSVDFSGMGGEYYIDATDVRWLPYNTGSGSIPAVGTTISQGGVSGYFLGVWDSTTYLPASGTVPSSGWIKLREVTGGAFAAGSLTGITASATAADEPGWIELVYDAASNITIPRLGKMTSRGDWFKLGQTNGSVGQQLTVPSTSSSLTNNYIPGVWVETAVGSGIYEFWAGLSSSGNGWARQHLGQPRGSTDKRAQFVKTFGSGIVQFGEDVDLSGTYATAAAQSSTYASVTAVSGTYTWASDVVTVTCNSAHLLDDGMQVGLDFTSGGATAYDNIYTATVIDAYTFTVPLSGSGSAGNVGMRAGVTITFTAHGLMEGEQVYCDFTSGTGADGTYTIWRRASANAYVIAYPTTAALTAGNVSVYSTTTITYAGHGLAVGNTVKLNFTSGTLTDGIYTIRSVATDTFAVNAFVNGGTSGNVTIEITIGHVPASGCNVRIPNIFIAECATGSRATNSVPNSTVASRPQLTTTAAGAVDLEYISALSFHTGVVGQAYSLRLYHCAFQDALIISEIASALDLDNIGVGMYGAQDARTFALTTCKAGGSVKNIWAMRGNTPGTGDHAFVVEYSNDITFENIWAGIVQFARSSGYPIQITGCKNMEFDTVHVFNNTGIVLAQSHNISFYDVDHCDRFIGRTNATTTTYVISSALGNSNIKLDGMTLGLGGTLDDCHPYGALVYCDANTDAVFRNLGTRANPLKTGIWCADTYGVGYPISLVANNVGVKVQKVYVTRVRTLLMGQVNSNKNVLYDRVWMRDKYINTGTGTPRTVFTVLPNELNVLYKAVTTGGYPTTGQTSVYGSHFYDLFLGEQTGAIILAMCEPTSETAQYYSEEAGTPRFNSAGGIEMRVIGDQAIWEMPYYCYGHTAFANITPVMSGGTIGNYTLEYQIDKNDGNGWNGTWTTLSAANLTAEGDISGGFKLKIRITTGTTNTTAITHLRIYTTSTEAEQDDLYYPLDEVDVTVTVLDATSKTAVAGARVLIETSPGGTELVNEVTDSNGQVTFKYDYLGDQAITGRVRKGSSSTYYKTSDIIGTITDEGFSATILMIGDE